MIKIYDDKEDELQEQTSPQNNIATATNATQPTATTPTNEAEEDSTPKSWADVWGLRIKNQGDALKGKVDTVDKRAAALEKEMQALEEAKKRHGSTLQALMEEQKPGEYDAKREKKLRTKATIGALGDVLSAVAAGAHAFGKNGAGVVPTLSSNSPYKSIEEINRLQEEYRKKNEAWKALDIKWRGAQADADLKDAKAEYAKALATYDEAKKDYNSALTDYDESYEAYIKSGVEEEGRNNRAALKMQGDMAKEAYKLKAEEEKKAKVAEDKYFDDLTDKAIEALYAAEMYKDTVETSTSTTGEGEDAETTTKTTRKPFDRTNVTDTQRKNWRSQYGDSPQVKLMVAYMAENESSADQALQYISGITEAGVEAIYEGYIKAGGTKTVQQIAEYELSKHPEYIAEDTTGWDTIRSLVVKQ